MLRATVAVVPTPTITPTPTPAATTPPDPTVTPSPTPTPTEQPTATSTSAPTTTPTPTAAATSPHWTVYRSNAYGYETEIPADWTVERDAVRTQFIAPNRLAFVSVEIFRDPPATPAGWIEGMLDHSGIGEPEIFDVLDPVSQGTDGRLRWATVRYRYRYGPEICLYIARHLIVASESQTYKIASGYCEERADNLAPEVAQILDGLRYWDPTSPPPTPERSPAPAAYYTQFIDLKGVQVKAHQSVDPAAVEAGAEIVQTMLAGSPDIAQCMARKGGDLAIIPRKESVVTLPEYRYLAGTKDFTGRPRDGFYLRGLGGVEGQPVSSAGEEQLLGRWGSGHPFYPYRGQVAVHEYAHGIQNLCFAAADHERWNALYAEAKRAGVHPGSHMMHNSQEFFAVLSTVYFEVTMELGPGLNRGSIPSLGPMGEEALNFLDAIYGGAVLPEVYRKVRRRL